ncbi:MAG TPA: phosphate ABC transporter permease subunit PstC [Chthoniobacterales bacterium]|nr:phosphate ABC transporter permease subunit PstC [Chthoniobacterales bacterium]
MPVRSPETDPKTGLKDFRKGPDLFRILCGVASVATVATLAWMILEITHQSLPAIGKFGLGFLFDNRWQPNREIYGVLPFLLGTTVSSLIAILFALPLGLSVAIFLSEDFLPPTARQFIRFTIEMLAAIPSVVYGLWGIFVVVPLVKEFGMWAVKACKGVPILGTLFGPPAYPNSILTASLVLALMILPTITAISRAALVAVPQTLREGSYALGATRWETIFNVLLPTAAPGIVAATILALGRAMGETMAVAMLIGNSPRFTGSLISPGGTLASLLANQFGEAVGLQVASLMYAALILMALTLLVNIAGEAVLRYTQSRTAGIR